MKRKTCIFYRDNDGTERSEARKLNLSTIDRRDRMDVYWTDIDEYAP